MFNLLVSAGGWADGRDTLLASRAFEHTEQHLIDKYKPEGNLDFAGTTCSMSAVNGHARNVINLTAIGADAGQVRRSGERCLFGDPLNSRVRAVTR